jgi:hypothetical protein
LGPGVNSTEQSEAAFKQLRVMPTNHFVDWPEHTKLAERVAVVETLLAEKIPSLEDRLDEAKKIAEDTNGKVTQHIADEDKVWMNMEKKQDDAYTQFNQKLDALSTADGTIKKSTVERWFWKTFGILVSVPFALYYLILLWGLVK